MTTLIEHESPETYTLSPPPWTNERIIQVVIHQECERAPKWRIIGQVMKKKGISRVAVLVRNHDIDGGAVSIQVINSNWELDAYFDRGGGKANLRALAPLRSKYTKWGLMQLFEFIGPVVELPDHIVALIRAEEREKTLFWRQPKKG